MEQLVQLLKSKNLTICSVESFTTGLFANKIGSISGVSKCYKGSLICYQNDIKINVLGVDENLVKKYGVVSKEVVEEMVKKGSVLFNSDLCIGFSGNAGPTVMENKPIGLIYMAIYFKGYTEVFEKYYKGNREEIKNQAILDIIEEIYKKIK